MSAIPTRRLLVYVAAGVAVLAVGTLGLLSMRGGAGSDESGVVIEAGDAVRSMTGSYGALDATVDAEGAPETGSTTLRSGTTTTLAPLIWVQVAGAVRRPGVYQVAVDARLFQAVVTAGGFTEEADEEAVALAAPLSDGCRIYVPTLGEMVPGSVQGPMESSAGVTGGASRGASSGGVVSLNSATAEVLDSLPGIGPALAQQIITYRETQGPFTSIDQLTDVPGIGPAKWEQLRLLVGL